jgi:RNA polymerase sigma factor (sigma-70 family)
LPYDPTDTHDWQNLHGVETPPGEFADRMALRERLVDEIDLLNEVDRTLFDGCFIERLTVRELGERLNLPKSTVWNRRNAITKRLRTALADDHRVKDYLNR